MTAQRAWIFFAAFLQGFIEGVGIRVEAYGRQGGHVERAAQGGIPRFAEATGPAHAGS